MGFLFNVADVEVRELNTSNPLGRIRIRVLEVKIVLSFLVKLGRSNVKCDLDLAFIASFLDGLREELWCFLRAGDVWREASPITHADGCKSGHMNAVKM